MAEYLRREDYENFGGELLDVSARAAMQAVAPHLQQLEQSNAELQRRLAVEARRNLDQRVAAEVPDFREIDSDPRWHNWLRQPDQFSGVPRQQLLNDAIASGSSQRVRAFFEGFRREAGTQSAPAHSERARTASSNRLPTYTPASIGELYARHRRGEFAGREAEWNRIEADIFRAQREGRVQGVYLSK